MLKSLKISFDLISIGREIYIVVPVEKKPNFAKPRLFRSKDIVDLYNRLRTLLHAMLSSHTFYTLFISTINYLSTYSFKRKLLYYINSVRPRLFRFWWRSHINVNLVKVILNKSFWRAFEESYIKCACHMVTKLNMKIGKKYIFLNGCYFWCK